MSVLLTEVIGKLSTFALIAGVAITSYQAGKFSLLNKQCEMDASPCKFLELHPYAKWTIPYWVGYFIGQTGKLDFSHGHDIRVGQAFGDYHVMLHFSMLFNAFCYLDYLSIMLCTMLILLNPVLLVWQIVLISIVLLLSRLEFIDRVYYERVYRRYYPEARRQQVDEGSDTEISFQFKPSAPQVGKPGLLRRKQAQWKRNSKALAFEQAPLIEEENKVPISSGEAPCEEVESRQQRERDIQTMQRLAQDVSNMRQKFRECENAEASEIWIYANGESYDITMTGMMSISEKYCKENFHTCSEAFQDALAIQRIYRAATSKDCIKKFRTDLYLDKMVADNLKRRFQCQQVEEDSKVSDCLEYPQKIKMPREELGEEYINLLDLDQQSDGGPMSSDDLKRGPKSEVGRERSIICAVDRKRSSTSAAGRHKKRD